MQALYMFETVGCHADELCALDWVDKTIPDDIRDFAVSLIGGSIENINHIDNIINDFSKNWEFERIGVVDKSILRLSIYTLLYVPDVPGVVAINEGVELGKLYGGDASGQFINGVLDAVRKSELKSGGEKEN